MSWVFIREKLGKGLYPVLLSGRVKQSANSNLLNCVSGHLGFLLKRRLPDFFWQPPRPEEVTACRGNRCGPESPTASKARTWVPWLLRSSQPRPRREPRWLSRWPQAVLRFKAMRSGEEARKFSERWSPVNGLTQAFPHLSSHLFPFKFSPLAPHTQCDAPRS